MWDVIKFKIKDFAIRYGEKIKKINLEEKQQLLKIIEDIKNVPNFIEDDRIRKELFDAEAKLNSIIDIEIKGAITRSRAQWTEEGEKSTKYFSAWKNRITRRKVFANLLIMG